jgi:hypothetical protein
MQKKVTVLYTTTKVNPARLLLALEKEVLYQPAQRRLKKSLWMRKTWSRMEHFILLRGNAALIQAWRG